MKSFECPGHHRALASTFLVWHHNWFILVPMADPHASKQRGSLDQNEVPLAVSLKPSDRDQCALQWCRCSGLLPKCQIHRRQFRKIKDDKRTKQILYIGQIGGWKEAGFERRHVEMITFCASCRMLELSQTSFCILALKALWQLGATVLLLLLLPQQCATLGGSCWHGEFNAAWSRISCCTVWATLVGNCYSCCWPPHHVSPQESLQTWTILQFVVRGHISTGTTQPKWCWFSSGRALLRTRWPYLLGWNLQCTVHIFSSFFFHISVSLFWLKTWRDSSVRLQGLFCGAFLKLLSCSFSSVRCQMMRICTHGPDAAVATRHGRSVGTHPAGWTDTHSRTSADHASEQIWNSEALEAQ